MSWRPCLKCWAAPAVHLRAYCKECLNRKLKTPKYELDYDDCVHPDWEGPDNFGVWRCVGCGVHRGGL